MSQKQCRRPFAEVVPGLLAKWLKGILHGKLRQQHRQRDEEPMQKNPDKKIKELKELDRIAKMLVRRDLALTEMRDKREKELKQLEQRTEELEKSRKALLNILEDTATARAQAETERNKAEAIFENFIDGILILDADYNIDSINPAAEVFLGIKGEDFLGKKITALAKVSKELKNFVKLITRKTKELYRQEFSLKEEKLVLEITTRFITVDKKRIVTLIILHNITREKIVERLKSQFVSVAAHQLRTPLSIIKWTLSMFLAGEVGLLTQEQKEMLAKANQTNERMIRLINDLLNVARIEEGRFIYHPKTVDLIEFLESLIKPIKTMAENKGLKFEFKKPRDIESKIVKADIEKLRLAVKNLLENAIFYTQPGGRVALIVERKKDRVYVTIKDTGIGIPEDQQDRVFSKFFRGDNAVRLQTEGTGLGLFITKNIIEAHKGEISFQSEPGKGSKFTFSLPVIG